jgi:hypothetical protein
MSQEVAQLCKTVCLLVSGISESRKKKVKSALSEALTYLYKDTEESISPLNFTEMIKKYFLRNTNKDPKKVK